MSALKSTLETDVYHLARTHIVSEEPSKEIIDTTVHLCKLKKHRQICMAFIR